MHGVLSRGKFWIMPLTCLGAREGSLYRSSSKGWQYPHGPTSRLGWVSGLYTSAKLCMLSHLPASAFHRIFAQVEATFVGTLSLEAGANSEKSWTKEVRVHTPNGG